MAQKYGDTGINMFWLHIPSFRIRRDKFMKVLQCYICYASDSHISNKCPVKDDNPSFMVCYSCSSTNHRYQSCPEQHNFKCVNCNGAQKTIAIACPKKLDFVEAKRQQSTNTATYANVIKSTTLPQNTSTNPNTLSKSISITTTAVMKSVEKTRHFCSQTEQPIREK